MKLLASLAMVGFLFSTESFAARKSHTPLTVGEIQFVLTEGGGEERLKNLDVFLDRGLNIQYRDTSSIARRAEVTAEGIDISTYEQRNYVLIKRNVKGRIVDLEEGAVFVSFNPSCLEKSCAHKFAQVEDEFYFQTAAFSDNVDDVIVTFVSGIGRVRLTPRMRASLNDQGVYSNRLGNKVKLMIKKSDSHNVDINRTRESGF